jgi:hypothetical protein
MREKEAEMTEEPIKQRTKSRDDMKNQQRREHEACRNV